MSLLHLEYLKTQLQENISIHLTKEQLPNSRKKLYYLSIGDPNHTTPNKQADSYSQCVRLRTSKLRDDFFDRIQLMCDENLPVLDEMEESSLEEEVEEDIEMQEVQVIEEELDGVQKQEPEYQPYQLTRFYWNQLDHFHEDYRR
jgi:hypothetical protein